MKRLKQLLPGDMVMLPIEYNDVCLYRVVFYDKTTNAVTLENVITGETKPIDGNTALALIKIWGVL